MSFTSCKPARMARKIGLAEAGSSDICVQYGAAAGGASIVVAREKD
jgi:hypothetical protein